MTKTDAIDVEARDEPRPDGPPSPPASAPAPEPEAAPEAAPETATAGTAVERHHGQNAAVAAAAEAALAMPGVPGRDEFLGLAMQARMLSLSGAAPPAVRDNPYVAFHVAMVGRDLGISPSAALELIDVIDGQRGPQLSLSPQLLNAQVRRLGLGEIVPAVRTNDRAVAIAVGPGGLDRRCRRVWPDEWPMHHPDCGCDILGTSEFTWEDARLAGIVGEKCYPGEHVKQTRKRRDGSTYQACGCNQGYVTYPKRMLWWRASGFAADDYFPEAGLGLYSPEELGAVVDDEGRPIDPAQVALPEGYVDERAERRERQAQAEQPADPGDLHDLQLRLRALPEGLQDEVRERWQATNALAGTPVWRLNPRQLRTAKSMVNGFEAKAKAAGVDLDAQRAWLCEELADGLTAAVRGVQGPAGSAGGPPEPPHSPESDPEDPAGGSAPGDAPAATGESEASDPRVDRSDPPQAAAEDAHRAAEDLGQTDAGNGSHEDEGPPKAEWRKIMAALAQRVRDVGAGVDHAVIARITDEVKGLHHTKLNAQLIDRFGADYEIADGWTLGQGSPIDYRRMLLSLELLSEWREANPGNGGVLDDRGEEPL